MHRLGRHRIGVDDRPADVAERVVQRVRQGVHAGRLVVTGDDDAGAAMRAEILGHRREPRAHTRARGPSASAAGAELGRERPRERLDVGRGERQAVIGARARHRRHALDRVEPVHRGPGCRRGGGC